MSSNNPSPVDNAQLADGYMSFMLGLHDPPAPNLAPRIENSAYPRVQPSEIASNPGSLVTAGLGQRLASDNLESQFSTQKEREDALAQVCAPYQSS